MGLKRFVTDGSPPGGCGLPDSSGKVADFPPKT